MDYAFNDKWHTYENKPIESRALRPNNGTGKTQKGALQCWVDILSAEDADDEENHPKWDITPPPFEKFELRVVIWDTTGTACHAVLSC